MCDSLLESDKIMDLEQLNTLLEEKEKVIQEMADRLFITKEELLAKVREFLDLCVVIKERHQKELRPTSSSSTDPAYLKADARKTRSLVLPPSEPDSKAKVRKSWSMVKPPSMEGEQRAEDKQAVAEAILGKKMVGPSASTSTQTQWSESRQAEVADRKVTVVDTRDWLSSEFSHRLRQDICLEESNQKELRPTSSSSTEPADIQPGPRRTRSLKPCSKPDSKTKLRSTRSMGMPPSMEEELRLVLLGKRAEDKQAVAEAILGKKMVVPQVRTSTQTHWSESLQTDVADRKVRVVNTPDWFSPAFSQRLRQDVRLCMGLSRPGPHVFLLVIPVDKLEGEEGNIPDKMEDIFGETCWEYTIILFTSTEGMGQTKMEEFIQRKQLLVERCENKYHLIDLSVCGANETLLKTIETMRGDNGGFYGSQMYLEAEAMFIEVEAKMHLEKVQRKEKRKRAEKEMEQQFGETLQESMKKVQEQIREHECELQVLNDKMLALEREIREEQDERKIRARERELKREAVQKEEVEKKVTLLKQTSVEERKEMEAKYKAEVEELRERYKIESRAVKERYIMKMFLSGLHKNICSTISLFQENFLPENFFPITLPELLSA